jgi:23S rRNA (adenine2503-C2)-methyltransferase
MNIYSLTRDEMEEYFISHGSKKFHADQLFSWLYEKRISSVSEITDIKKDMLEQLERAFSFSKLKLVTVERDVDVCKYLFELYDGEHIEAVLMRHDYGNSVCVSSQVGCNMGCKFCESGRRKRVRNLEVYEMVIQLLMIEEDLGERISHVVVMGIGEPFDNYDNLLKFLLIINHPKGLAIGARHITVSTCGIVPKILEFSEFPLQINLAISLHAPNDTLRDKIMPINKAYPLKELISALEVYLSRTNRRITFEYIMLSGVNDSVECAKELVELVGHLNCYVNLIPYNETNNLEFKRSSTVQIMKFYDILKKNRLGVTIRREFGSKISAACGQLRSKKEEL